jgi:hypothetical protein
MKSSSALFPVSLLKADCVGVITEDTYLIKHNLDPDLSVQIAISRLGRQGVSHSGMPLILVHGSFTNRGFWLSRGGQGLARFLLEDGFDIWLLEHRGHGLSPRNQDYVNNSVERYALYDLPAAQAFVTEQTGKTPAWIGHSLGGGMIATALAAGGIATKAVQYCTYRLANGDATLVFVVSRCWFCIASHRFFSSGIGRTAVTDWPRERTCRCHQ